MKGKNIRTPGRIVCSGALVGAWVWKLQQGAFIHLTEGGDGMIHAIELVHCFSDLWAYVHPDIVTGSNGGLAAAGFWWRHAVKLD